MAKPLQPPTIYHDGQSIYLEWPSHVQRFLFTEAGLHKALRMIPHIASTPGYVTGKSNIADKLIDSKKIKIARKTAESRATVKLTEGQHRDALDALRFLKPKG